VLIKKVNHN